MKNKPIYLTVYHCVLFGIFMPEIEQYCVDAPEDVYALLPFAYKLVDYTIDYVRCYGIAKANFDDNFILLDDAGGYLIEGLTLIKRMNP